MTTSSRTTSYSVARRASSASRPFTAAPTVWPCCSRLRFSSARLTLSSSTTRTWPVAAVLGECRVVGDLNEPACQGLEDFVLNARVVPNQVPEGLPRQHEE